jgi:hypothetical protein
MKAISIRSPWWEKIVSGEKTIETRTWQTKYRGPLLIHASKPKGAIVGAAYLRDCRPMTERDEYEACCKLYPRANAWVLSDAIPFVGVAHDMKIPGRLGFFDVDMKQFGMLNFYFDPWCKMWKWWVKKGGRIEEQSDSTRSRRCKNVQ